MIRGEIRVVGTAGHVDHGKTALVKALTGIDPDRLPEERERQMTIDLGFAWLPLPSGRVASFIDVPGHEDFIQNMLAGIGGIDAALLVVAADEGVMPQTREHLDILHLLQVRRGLVALTKNDLVEDPEWLSLVKAEVMEILRGTTLAEAPILPISAITQQGLDDLVRTLDGLLAVTPARQDRGRPRLSIDRVFSLAGFGTVVTGTLIDGHLSTGQEVEILPPGLRARIRGLQTHKEKIEIAVPGSRVAINLAGIEVDQLRRGDVVALAGSGLSPTRMLDAHLTLLRDASRPLKHNARLEFFSGSTRIPAVVRLLGRPQLEPGEEGWAQIFLAQPAVLVARDRFVLRSPSPSLTLGGGEVIDPHPPRRYRRVQPELLRRLEALASGSPEAVLLETLRRQEPMEIEELIRRSGLTPEVGQAALDEMVAGERVLVLDQSFLISPRGWESLTRRMIKLLEEYHRQNPLRRGMPREELKSRLGLNGRSFSGVLQRARETGGVVESGVGVRLPSHEVRFTPQQEERIAELMALFCKNPYAPPSVSECETLVGSEVLAALIEQGRLVRVSDSILFTAEAYREMVQKVVEHIRAHGSVTVAEVRDMFGASRKYAVALLEYLDQEKITKRVGDERVLRE